MNPSRIARRPKQSVPGAADASVAGHLEQMAPALRAIVRAARRALTAAAPAATETPYRGGPPRSRSAVWKIARYGVGDVEVAGIGAVSTYVLLYFYRGIDLDDGSGLLEGGGKAMRSIKLRTPEDAARPDVRRIVRRAFELASERHPEQRR
jgi:hypothetical protein